MIPFYGQKKNKREKDEGRGHGKDQFGVERDLSFFLSKKPCENIFSLLKDEKTQASKNNQDEKSDIYPGISSVGKKTIAEQGEPGIAKSRNGMKDRMREGLEPREFFLPSEEK